MMSVWTHIKSQPFVAATAAAALVHSSWSLGTLFSGVQPAPPVIGDALQLWIEFFVKSLAWHIPAVAIAFAFDVGQVVTAHEIRTAHSAARKPWRKYVTFVVFAAATYYLQMLYAAHHFPQLALGAGVSEAHSATVQMWLDAAVWVIPMFLPLATLLYTFSGDGDAHRPDSTETHQTATDVRQRDVVISRQPLDALPSFVDVLVSELTSTPVPMIAERIEPRYTGVALPSFVDELVMELLTTPRYTPVIMIDSDQPPIVDYGLIEADAMPLPFDTVNQPKPKPVHPKPSTTPKVISTMTNMFSDIE